MDPCFSPKTKSQPSCKDLQRSGPCSLQSCLPPPSSYSTSTTLTPGCSLIVSGMLHLLSLALVVSSAWNCLPPIICMLNSLAHCKCSLKCGLCAAGEWLGTSRQVNEQWEREGEVYKLWPLCWPLFLAVFLSLPPSLLLSFFLSLLPVALPTLSQQDMLHSSANNLWSAGETQP